MTNQVYDDEDLDKKVDKAGADQLREITGMGTGEEDQMDAAARDNGNYGSESSARAAKNRRASQIRRENATERTGGTIGSSLNDQENAASPAAGVGGKALGRDALNDSEKAGPSFYKDDEGPIVKKVRWSRRRRIGLGVAGGGIVGGVLMFTTLSTVYNVPSLTDVVGNIMGRGTREVVEHRFRRMAFNFLIEMAGGNPDKFIVRGSLGETLIDSWRLNRVDLKIKNEAGLEIVRQPDGMHLISSGEDLGKINSYDDIAKLHKVNPRLAKQIRKMERIVLKPWNIFSSSKARLAFETRYGRDVFRPPVGDTAEAVREGLVEKTERAGRNVIADYFRCALTGGCERFTNDSKKVDVPEVSEHAKETAEKVVEAVDEASEHAKETAVKEAGHGMVETVEDETIKQLTSKAATGPLALVLLAVDLLDLEYIIKEFNDAMADNPDLYNISATLTAASLGTFYTVWQGHGDNIKAGKLSLKQISVLNAMTSGATGGAAWQLLYRNKPNTGVLPQVRVEDDAHYPAQSLMKYYSYIPGIFVLDAWKPFHFIIGALTDAVVWITERTPGYMLMVSTLEKIFGKDWEKKVIRWTIQVFLRIMGKGVDALATGPQWINQLAIGAAAAWNALCRQELGCMALTPLVDRNFFQTPLNSYNTQQPFGSNMFAASEEDRLDMAVLPLKDRLFSLDEPYSLANELFRRAPTSPSGIIQNTASLVGSIPYSFASIFTGRVAAEGEALTNQQLADLGGTRWYGGTTEQLDQEIATEVRQSPTTDPECPPNDPEHTFNVCQADKTIMKSLLCQYNDCPEYAAFKDSDSDTINPITNISRLWSIKEIAGLFKRW